MTEPVWQTFAGEGNLGREHPIHCQRCGFAIYWTKIDVTRPCTEVLEDGRKNLIAMYASYGPGGTHIEHPDWAGKPHWCNWCPDCDKLLVFRPELGKGDYGFKTTRDGMHIKPHRCEQSPDSKVNRLKRQVLNEEAPEATVVYRESFSQRITELEEKYEWLKGIIDKRHNNDFLPVERLVQRLCEWTHLPLEEKKE